MHMLTAGFELYINDTKSYMMQLPWGMAANVLSCSAAESVVLGAVAICGKDGSLPLVEWLASGAAWW